MFLVIEQYNENMSMDIAKYRTKEKAVEYLESMGYGDFEEEIDANGNKQLRGSQDYNTCFIVPLRRIKTMD